MQTIVTATLSKNSFSKVAEYLNEYKKNLKKGVENSIEKVTLMMYEAVLAECYGEGILNHTSKVNYEYDKELGTGKVYTNDHVIIFNEMGTGITGKTKPHPSPSKMFKEWEYDVNEHGEAGWYYPKQDGTYGWTKGLPSRHMFYNALDKMKDDIKDTFKIEIYKTTEDLYERSI